MDNNDLKLNIVTKDVSADNPINVTVFQDGLQRRCKLMNIVYASDDNFVSILGISMISLFENNKEPITVYIFADGIKDKNKELLLNLGKDYEQGVEIIDVNVDDYSSVKLDNLTWSRATFSRLFIGTILKPYNLDRVLYLDCDVVINRSIKELWDMDLKDAAIGMAVDPISKGHKKNVGIDVNCPYYNAGVLLIELPKWLEYDCERKLQDFSIKHRGKTPYVDQGLINGALKEHIAAIPLRYNLITIYCDYDYNEILTIRKPTGYFYSKEEVEEASRNPVIIHFTKSIFTERPWVIGSTHKKLDVWNKYKRLSPWRNETLLPATTKGIRKIYAHISCYLPRKLSVRIQGFLHSIVKPMVDPK